MSERIHQITNEMLEETVDIPEELINSTAKILNYADISKEDAFMFKINLEKFRMLADKSLVDKDALKIRDAISSTFFDIYSSVLKKVSVENNPSRLYQMFLKYAYIDEKLLEPNQTRVLYEMVAKPNTQAQCSFYNLKDWLEKIFSKEEEPSVNEFGLDYYEVFREKKKRGEFLDKDKHGYDNNADARLSHEINNLFNIGQKLCCGQMSRYFPILHSGMISNDLSKALVTSEMIEESLNRILQVDFSAFHREIVCNMPEKGIKKELIMKSVLPDLILMPIFGSRAVMWQELTGRVKSSPGRFILPIFTDEDLDNLMIEVIARFRWDLSKNMFSYIRNDGNQSSLTADYSNYLQFYRKNGDLSNDAKEKIKTQIAKYRNNVREIFASDYYTWINYESQGIVRLNKVVREIFFKYCPFSKTIRADLEKHPLYNQYIIQYEKWRIKHHKVIQAHYSQLVKPNVPLDAELEGNLAFYNM
ncbi:MAG: hypothetical protein CVU90_08670 [Firmicutes bacterium HGW-Firmicutes-15]|nr:MAG: hypothetical protein CVU90_08670 [Firmicutes bacterium HGW-Firmicutes-15]